MFIELEDLDGLPIIIKASTITALGVNFCIADGVRHDTNHTPEEILRTIYKALAHQWELENV